MKEKIFIGIVKSDVNIDYITWRCVR